MPKFAVYVTLTAPISARVEVEAKSGIEAAASARRKVMEDKAYKLHDFDGNAVQVNPADITVDHIERG